jgi:hypothetical protein
MSSRLMQLAALYGVRGAIATQTMKNLEQHQIERVGGIVEEIINDDSLAGDKYEFIKQLGLTIGGDYRSDRETALEEFRIALWRAAVYLLYHKSYSYMCTLCGQMEYETSTGKIKAFDRQYPACPSCSQSFKSGKVVSLVKTTNGYTLVDEDKNIINKSHAKDKIEKKLETPIKAIGGKKAVDDPEEILKDKEQRSKWFSVWVWNYFRQVLNENTIKTHNKQKVELSAPANIMAVYLIINELKKKGIRYYFDESTEFKAGNLEVFVTPLSTDLVFTAYLVSLIKGYGVHGIEFEITDYSIKIKSSEDSPIVSDEITTEMPVIMVSYTTSNRNNDGDDRNWGDAVEHNAMEIYNGDLTRYIEDESLIVVRENLPNINCQKVMDIYCQKGKIWQEFASQYGTKVPAKAHISKFLDVTTKKVEEYRVSIKKMYSRIANHDNAVTAMHECRSLVKQIADEVEYYVDAGKDEDDAINTALLDLAELFNGMKETKIVLNDFAALNKLPNEDDLFDAVIMDFGD